MRQREKNGVRLGQPVRDLDGKSLGKVVRLFDWGFEARRGPPILFGHNYVLRYDEIRAVRDGALVISRSDRDLFQLAAGEIPHTWRIATPAAFPTAATPSEARYVLEDVAAGRVPGASLDVEPVPPPPVAAGDARAESGDEQLREYVRSRGQASPGHRASSDR